MHTAFGIDENSSHVTNSTFASDVEEGFIPTLRGEFESSLLDAALTSTGTELAIAEDLPDKILIGFTPKTFSAICCKEVH